MRVRIGAIWLVVVAALLAAAWPTQASADDRDVGIWFSTWYYQHRVTLWSAGHGVNSSKQMLGDLNGDGTSDSIAFFASTGNWQGALSDGTVFGGGTLLSSGHGIGSDKQFLADVNGDGRDDAVIFFKGPGVWYVALSHGNGFYPYAQWISGHGAGTANQMMGDVNGDGRSDAIVYNNGSWYSALSTGSAFGPGYGQWASGHGSGSTSQILGDVNGDGRDDAVVFFKDGGLGGNWYVSLSNGGTFGPGYTQWKSGHGIGSDYQWLADVNDDGRDDAIVAFRNSTTIGGEWHVARSTGSGFNSSYLWKSHLGANSAWMGVGDVDGDGKSDAMAFTAGEGTWRAVPADFTDYNTMSLWNEWAIGYRPLVNGSARQYDSGNTDVIRYQLRQIDDADIDFLLFDLTNNLEAEPMLSNALAVCHEAKALNASEGRDIKVAVAIGGIQFNPDPLIVEVEAGLVGDHFLDDPDCGPSTYYQLDGKPLLISYSAGYSQRQSWESYPNHSQTSDFTVRFAQGTLPNATSYPSRYPNGGCGTPPSNPSPPQADHGLYTGWGIPFGTLPSNGGIATVMPGWNNHQGQFVSRTQYGSPGGFYLNCGWDRVLSANPKPSMVIINSYNEYAEQTAVAPANTNLVGGGGAEPWPSPSYYWDITVNKITQYKSAP